VKSLPTARQSHSNASRRCLYSLIEGKNPSQICLQTERRLPRQQLASAAHSYGGIRLLHRFRLANGVFERVIFSFVTCFFCVHSRFATFNASTRRSMRSFGSGNPNPYAICSFSWVPAPMPNSNLPPETTSSVAAVLASKAGFLWAMQETIVPSRILLVAQARAEGWSSIQYGPIVVH